MLLISIKIPSSISLLLPRAGAYEKQFICCIANHNCNTSKFKTQVDSVVQVRTVLLTSDFGSSTRGKRHNSYYAIHTILPHKRAAHPVMFKKKKPTTSSMVKIQFSTSRQKLTSLRPMAETQLSACMVQCQLPTDSFSKSSNSQLISSGHDVIHTPATFPVWGLLWQSPLSYLCARA